MIKSLRIVNGYLEIDYSYGYIHIGLMNFQGSVYATPEVIARVNQYHRQNPDPFNWPNMVYDEARAIWEPLDKAKMKESNEQVALERFILYCRGKQNEPRT